MSSTTVGETFLTTCLSKKLQWKNSVRGEIPINTIFHYPTRANVNTYPILVCALGCTAQALWCTVQHIIFVYTPYVCWKWERIRMLHWLIIRKYNISLEVLLLFSDSLFPRDKSYFLFAKKIRGFFHNKETRSSCTSATVLASEKELF